MKSLYRFVMKHDELRSIAHNIADSLASGIGLLIGVYVMDIFGEAAKSPEGFIAVDFLHGTTTGGKPSKSLAKAIDLYRDALSDLCERHGVSVSSFRKLIARYSVDVCGQPHGQRVVIEVEDNNGRSSTDEYVGLPLRRIKTLDNLGRIRTKRH